MDSQAKSRRSGVPVAEKRFYRFRKQMPRKILILSTHEKHHTMFQIDMQLRLVLIPP